jgi:branched-chain amino acid transport system substrate-binding protein
MHSNKKLIGAALALLAVLAVGCGSSDDSSSSTSGSKPAAKALTPNVTGDPIVVGMVCSCTGASAGALGPSADIAQAWAAWTNAHGGINGHPVKVITADDQQNPAKSLAAVKKLVEEDHVMALVGPASTVDGAWADYVTKKGIPVVGGDVYEPTYLTNPNFYPSGATLATTFFGLAKLAKDAGKKQLETMYCAETPVCAQIETLIGGLAGVAGIKTHFSKVSQTAPNYTAPCLAAKKAGSDALFAAVLSQTVVRVTDGCAQQGYKPLTASTTAVAQSDWLSHDTMEGALVSSSNLPIAADGADAVPAAADFQAAIAAKVPKLKGTAQYGNPNIMTWAGGQLFKAAGEAAKLTPISTPADVKKGLYALKDETLGGLAPPLTFVEGKPAFPACYFTTAVKDGRFTLPDGVEPVCISPENQALIGKALGG